MSLQGFSQDQRQRLSQQLVLAPQLRQSLKILQVAAQELRTEVQQELQSNPALEELPMEGISLDAPADNGDDGDEPDSRETLDFDGNYEALSRLDQDYRDLMNQGSSYGSYTSEDAERRQHMFDSLVGETSLQEHLLRQAELTDCEPMELEALRTLIGSLDNRGFLTSTVQDLALMARMPLSVMQRAADLLKTLEPHGIGASSMQECLLLQLKAKGRQGSVAARIIADQFALLTRRRIPEIARKLSVTVDAVQHALTEIAQLDPAPGRRYAEDSNRVVTPDVTVEKDGDEWTIHLNSDYIPRLRINPAIKELLTRTDLSKQDRDYLHEKLRSGRFLISSIEQRQQTIEKITREILTFQKEFFEHGVSRLRPLTMTQVAERVGVHETTVSRAIASKFIQTPHGVFDLKYFFTPGFKSGDGADVSNTSVKEMIANLIAGEDPAAPYSDQDICANLDKRGLKIARRTVAKYREELGILPSNLRRHY
jgi:RNA polymerase sigma-54 factor